MGARRSAPDLRYPSCTTPSASSRIATWAFEEVVFRPIVSWLGIGRSPCTARAAQLADIGLARAESMWSVGGLPDDNPGGCGCGYVSFFFALNVPPSCSIARTSEI